MRSDLVAIGSKTRKCSCKIKEIIVVVCSFVSFDVGCRREDATFVFREAASMGLEVEDFGCSLHHCAECRVVIVDRSSAIVAAVDKSVFVDGKQRHGNQSVSSVIDEGHERQTKIGDIAV